MEASAGGSQLRPASFPTPCTPFQGDFDLRFALVGASAASMSHDISLTLRHAR